MIMTFRVRLKKARKPNQQRLKFDLEKLRDPDVACIFQTIIGGKFEPLMIWTERSGHGHQYHDYHLQYSSD